MMRPQRPQLRTILANSNYCSLPATLSAVALIWPHSCRHSAPGRDCNRHRHVFGIRRASGIAPISLTQSQDVPHCPLILEGERTTTYKPHIAAFSCERTGLEFLPVGQPGDKVRLSAFQQQAQDQASSTGKRILFASAPIKCNVAGFAEPVEALAVSYNAYEAPIRELPYKSPSSEEIKALLNEAEAAHRRGRSRNR